MRAIIVAPIMPQLFGIRLHFLPNHAFAPDEATGAAAR